MKIDGWGGLAAEDFRRDLSFVAVDVEVVEVNADDEKSEEETLELFDVPVLVVVVETLRMEEAEFISGSAYFELGPAVWADVEPERVRV